MQINEDLMSYLIKRTEAGEHRQFHFLRSWREYSDTRKIWRINKLITVSLKKSAKRLFNNYCIAIEAGETEVVNLLAYTTVTKVLKFWEEELTIISDMIDEYEVYLAAGNWLDFFLGTQRPIHKLWDHRG
jgi:hypothetical protein